MEQMRVIIRDGKGRLYADETMPLSDGKGFALRWRTDIKRNTYGDRTGWTVKTERKGA